MNLSRSTVIDDRGQERRLDFPALFCGRTSRCGFTLIELLVVMVIIGILASIGLPAMKGIGKANITAGAHRQLLDDLAYARLRAINDRTTVYVVFVPTNVLQKFNDLRNPPIELRSLTNLVTSQYIAYALFASRSVGDQPGRPTARYLTSWKTLPEGMLFPPYLFDQSRINHENEYERSLPTVRIPFPTAESSPYEVPYLAFNSFGQLVSFDQANNPLVRNIDRILSFAQGSIFYTRDDRGNLIDPAPDVQLIPPGQGTNYFQYVRIDAITGRAKAEIPQFSE